MTQEVHNSRCIASCTVAMRSGFGWISPNNAAVNANDTYASSRVNGSWVVQVAGFGAEIEQCEISIVTSYRRITTYLVYRRESRRTRTNYVPVAFEPFNTWNTQLLPVLRTWSHCNTSSLDSTEKSQYELSIYEDQLFSPLISIDYFMILHLKYISVS